MNKRRVIAILIAFVLTIAGTAMWSASTIEREGDPDVNVLEDSGADAGSASQQKKGGNKVVKVLAAPFKAFGRLFGGRDDKKMERMTEKDSERFASVGVTKIEDVRSRETKKTTLDGSAKQHLEAGRAYLLEGRYNEAVAELSTAASLDRGLTEAHNLLGVAYDKKGFSDRAKESFERAVKSDSDDPETLNNLGFSLYQSGNYRAAVDKLKRAAKLAPRDERILNNLGLSLCRLGKFDDAYKSFSRAGGALAGSLNMARMLERFGRDDDAIRYYETARQIDPNNTLALRRLADLYLRVGKIAESEGARTTLASLTNGGGNVASLGR